MKIVKTRKHHFIAPELLQKNSVIVDAGACIGEFVGILSENVEDTSMFVFYCIEPDDYNLSQIGETSGNMVVFDGALVGDRLYGVSTYVQVRKDKSATRRKDDQPWGIERGFMADNSDIGKRLVKGERDVSCFKKVSHYHINSVFNDIVIQDRIDLMKLDIEGSESDVILSMAQDVADRIMQITIECDDTKSIPDVKKALVKLGFKIEKFDGINLLAVRV